MQAFVLLTECVSCGHPLGRFCYELYDEPICPDCAYMALSVGLLPGIMPTRSTGNDASKRLEE